MIAHWVKVIYLALFLVDLWVMTNLWNVLGGGVYGILIVAFGILNLTIGMGVIQMAYLYSFRKEMEEEEDQEIEVHTFHYTVEKDPDSKVIQLIDSREPDLPPVS